jgi:hypothetical protein
MPTNGSCRPALPRARLLTPLVGRCRLGSDRLAAPQPPCGRSPRRLPIASSPVVCCPVTRRIGALSPVVSRPNAGRLPAQRRSSRGLSAVLSQPCRRPPAALCPRPPAALCPRPPAAGGPSFRGSITVFSSPCRVSVRLRTVGLSLNPALAPLLCAPSCERQPTDRWMSALAHPGAPL